MANEDLSYASWSLGFFDIMSMMEVLVVPATWPGALCKPYSLSDFPESVLFVSLTINQTMSCQNLLTLSNLDGEATTGASNK